MGYTTKGAMSPIASNDAYPMKRRFTVISSLLAEKPRRPNQQNQRHNQEHDRIRSLRIENLGQALDQSQTQSSQNGTQYRSHASDDHDRENDNDQVCSH